MNAHAKHAPNVKLYMMVFGALLFGTVLTVTVQYLDIPRVPSLILGIAIATVKASLVAAFFMHLKGEKAIIFGVLAVTVFTVLAFALIPIDSALTHELRDPNPVEIPQTHSEHAEPPAGGHP